VNATLEKRNAKIAVGGIAAAGAAIAGGRAALAQRDARRDRQRRRYRLISGEEPADGVRRIALGRLESSLEQLNEEAAKDPGPAIHEARKDLKKVRSLLRLVRDEIGDESYRRENGRYRHAGRLLSSARDAQVKLETLQGLNERFDDPAGAEWERYAYALREEADPGAGLGERIERATLEIERGRRAVDGWRLEANGWELFEPGLRRGYRRGRNRFAEAASQPTDEAVHEWRKRVKDLWYYLRLLRESKRKRIGKEADRAHELSDLLGDHHDLTVLREDARARPRLLGAVGLERLFTLIQQRQRELLDGALAVGERVYAEKPKPFARRHGRYWEAWR
jgi:CHAD domain-containing protein